MASFYDSASIITIPSGYKAGTLYSAKPTDGTGDMTFTRTGDTATRVNSAGIIERCITNALINSENFTAASWGKTRLSVTGDATTAPNGTLTADKLVEDSATGTHFTFSSGQNIGIGGVFSMYAKASERSKFAIREGTTTGAYAAFNLSTGAIIDSGSGASNVTITNVGSGWFRLQMVYTTGANVNFSLFVLNDAYVSGNPNAYSYTGNGTSGLFVWGAQLQLGDLATNYIPTTTAAVTEGPVTNLPRLDYFGSTCPQLLMEPTRTNLETYSQIFDNSSWVKTTASVSGNVAVSPDGYQNADALIEDTNSGIHSIAKALSFVSGTTYAISCFVKQGSGTRRFAIVTDGVAFGGTYICNFNLQTGVVVNSGAQIVGKIENYGNGWYRCSAIATATGTATRSITFCLRNSDATNISNYTGDGTSSLFVWGAQVEAGAYATSYIPTTAATVTRNNDLASKTSITSLIGQSEGTLFVDFDRTTSSVTSSDIFAFSLSNGGSQNRILIQYQPHNLSYIGAIIRVNSITLYDGNFNNSNSRIKIAIGYKLNDLAVYINGVQVGTNALSSDFSSNNLTKLSTDSGAGSNIFGSRINQTLVFKTRLTNDELATLTTL